MEERIERNVIIARSGCYEYLRNELPALNLTKESIPARHKDRESFIVYTPAPVLVAAKDLFAKLPIVIEHPIKYGNVVTPENYGELAKGWSGDTVEVVKLDNSEEIGIASTVNLLGFDALVYYECNVRDVSPGYWALYKWEDGLSADGQEYQIVKYEIQKVNHLAFTQSGRGGPEISMDSMPSLLYYTNRMTTDSNAPTFREMVNDIVANRLTYDSEEIETGVNAILGLLEAMPECEEKSILTRIVKDFYHVKNFTGNDAAQNAADIVADKYEAIDQKIMEDSMQLFGKNKKPTTDAAPPEVEEDKAPPTETAPEVAEVPENDPTESEDAESTGPGVAPVGPEAEENTEVATEEPIEQVAMEVEQMPDDVLTLSEQDLRACLNGVIKFLKKIAPGEAQEPQHQETVDSDVKPEGVGIPPMGDADPVETVRNAAGEFDKGRKAGENVTGDSLFNVFGAPVGDSKQGAKTLSDFHNKNFSKKGAK